MIELSLDKKSPVPFYRQIVDMVLAGISSGTILPGEKLSTIRNLAVTLGVNPNTVVKAYTHLQLLGVLDTQQGTGAFVRGPSGRRFSGEEKQRVLDDLCRDFVGRAQLLNISVDKLIGRLRQMQKATSSESTGQQLREKTHGGHIDGTD